MPKIPKKTYKDLHNFSLLNKVKNDNSFSHDVFLAKKTKKEYRERESLWYIKYLGRNRNEAVLETLAQEFYRLILLQQPKTRRTISKTKTEILVYHVLSKKISDFDEQFFLHPESNELILSNKITGLAATQVLALLLNEVDFKAGNVGIDPHNKKVIKIDGGFSFITLNSRFKNLYEGKNLDITQADLEALPNLVNYEACNWLHQIQWDLDKKCAIKIAPTELDKKINQNPNFKNEVYRTILRIISLPNLLIQFFTQSYITNSDDITRFSNFIIARKLQLSLAAIQIPAFNEYRQSNQAQEEMLDFVNYLKTFKTMHKSFLLREFEEKYKADIEASILGNTIKEYTPIKNFAIEIDKCLKRLIFTVDFHTLEINQAMLLPNREKIISDILSLKEIISEYLASPSLVKRNALYNTLSDIAETIKEKSVIENSIISGLIESINKLLFENQNKAPRPLPSMGFFKSHQKIPPKLITNLVCNRMP